MSSLNLVEDVIKPTHKQREFMRAVQDHIYTLYGGAAGGGKSYILRWMLVYLLIKWYKRTKQKGIRVGLFCEDYPSLKDRQLSKIMLEFPPWLGEFKKSDSEFVLSSALGGGVICFRNLDDPSKYLSSEFAAIAIDELTLNDQSVFEFLRMRLRWVGIDDPKMFFGTNPGGKGHMWVKTLFVDKILPQELKPFADKIAFIRARVDDNPHLPASYLASLDTLPEKLRKAYKDGDWNIFEGQAFSEFRTDLHVVEPFPIPSGWQRIRSMDWGYSKPYAIYEAAIDYDGVIYFVKEWYGTKPGTVNTGTQETAKEVAEKVAKDLGDMPGYADPAIWQKTGHNGPTIAEIFAQAGVPWYPADNDRLAGKMQWHIRLKEGKVKIFSNCYHLIRTLPALTYDKHKVEDIDTAQEDHSYDSARYLLMSRPIAPDKPSKPFHDSYRFVDDDREGVSAWGI